MDASPTSAAGGGGARGPGDSPGWTTVHARRRRQRQRKQRRKSVASDGEQHSQTSSSAASITHDEVGEGSDIQNLTSISLPPNSQRLLARQLADVEREGSAEGKHSYRAQTEPPMAATAASSNANGGRAAGSAPQQQSSPPPPQPPRLLLQLPPSGLQRQDSQCQSALSLVDLGRGPGGGLRSSKSDMEALSMHTARSSHSVAVGSQRAYRGHTQDDGGTSSPRAGAGPAGASMAAMLDPVPEPAAAARGPCGAQAFSAYLQGELHPGPSYPTADVVWGQTERDRVYNALVAVPYQLERFLLFGVAVCLDSFLAIFTLLPLRVGLALLALGRGLLSGANDSEAAAEADAPAGAPLASGRAGAGAGAQRDRWRSGTQHDAQQAQHGAQQQAQQQQGRRRRGWRLGRVQLRGDQLFDLLGAAMSTGVVLFLWNLNAGTLYFWMKDLTQELLKLSVLYTALELSDKICCSFGVDVLEALSASCTQLAAGRSRAAAFALCCDVVVASLLLGLHGATLMCQAMVFGVAMNSKKNTLVALLIAANFTEIKGTVLKRFDTTKLFSLACQDVVERFHLLLILAFVVVEEMGNSGSRSPNPALLVGCAHIYAGEVVIDIIKHAVLGKFNEIRPGVYREYMRDLCDRVSTSQSHNIHKPVGFEPFAPAALAFRIAATAAALRHSGSSSSAGSGGGMLTARPLAAAAAAGALLGAWLLLLLAKICLGYLLKVTATGYLRHYERRRGSRHQRRSTVLQPVAAAAVAATAAKGKEE